MHALRCEQLVPVDIDRVFEFFGRPENLARLTPAWLGFRILTPSPIAMREGAVIDYVIRLGIVPVRWRTLISAYDPPHRFVDEQLAGPYRTWHHTHTFTPADGGTLIADDVRYRLPFGPLGALTQKLMVGRQVASIFAHRTRVIASLFGPGATG